MDEEIEVFELCDYCEHDVRFKYKGVYMHRRCWEEAKADYDAQIAKDERNET